MSDYMSRAMMDYVDVSIHDLAGDIDASPGNPPDGNNMGVFQVKDTSPGGVAYPSADYDYLPGFLTRGSQETGAAEAIVGPWDTMQPDAYSFGGLHNLVTDPSIGGMVGQANRNPYVAGGPVESNTVEDFELRGAWYKVRRPIDQHSGPVGFSDYSGYLAAALASDAYPAISDDSAQYQIAIGI